MNSFRPGGEYLSDDLTDWNIGWIVPLPNDTVLVLATFFKTIETPIGILRLGSDKVHLKSVSFDAAMIDDAPGLPEILAVAQQQLEEYFEGIRYRFDLPIDPEGTDFQHMVWNKVLTVPFGSTKSYLDIVQALGAVTACRAVGMANGKNPIPIIIPCHRIIGHNGKLTGYAGGMERKKWLLLHEQRWTGDRLF